MSVPFCVLKNPYCFKKNHDIWHLSGHRHKLFNFCSLHKRKSNKIQNLRPLWQTHGRMFLVMSSVHIWPHRSGHCIQNFHPVIYKFMCFSLYLHLHSDHLITWVEPPDILGYSPFPLPVRHTQHCHKPCFLQHFAEEERVTKKRGEGRNQMHCCLILCGSAAVSHAVLLRMNRMSE